MFATYYIIVMVPDLSIEDESKRSELAYKN